MRQVEPRAVVRAIVIADSGTVLAGLTHALVESHRAEIVRHVNGRAHVGSHVHGFAPTLVLIHDMGSPSLALARVAEVREAAPAASIVVLAERLESTWLAQALRLGAAAVMPAGGGSETFRQILDEVLDRVPVPA
jgi:DNA-binding NarL/FixJ family response regulator